MPKAIDLRIPTTPEKLVQAVLRRPKPSAPGAEALPDPAERES